MEILHHYSPDAPVIARPYRIMVPAVKSGDISDPPPFAVSDLTALGWVLSVELDTYYYPALTITELADVTGEDAFELPPIGSIKPPIP